MSYTYYKTGQASNITIKDEGEGSAYDKYHDLALYYHSHGPLWRALWGSYELDQQQEPTGYETSWAREFSYDSPRARFLAADYDTGGSDYPLYWTQIEPALWTDYAGELPYRDREFEDDVFTDALLYLGTAAQQTAATNETAFLHGDLIGSTNLTTDDDGDALQTGAVAYTAFGEVIGDASTLATRYQYAGAWGYEADLLTLAGVNPNLPDITLQHVGARWYQPDIGRFVQRDPIGIDGGLNVYAYCVNDPLTLVDPEGDVAWWIPAVLAAVVIAVIGVVVGGCEPLGIDGLLGKAEKAVVKLWNKNEVKKAIERDISQNYYDYGKPRHLPTEYLPEGVSSCVYIRYFTGRTERPWRTKRAT